MTTNKFITINEAIEEYRLSRTTIYNLRKNNLIKFYQPTPKKVLILRKSLDDYFESVSSKFKEEEDE